MIKTIVPKQQTFKELPSAVFFVVPSDSTRLYQKMDTSHDANAILLQEESSGQRGHRYSFKVVIISPESLVSRVEVVDVEVKISSFV